MIYEARIVGVNGMHASQGEVSRDFYPAKVDTTYLGIIMQALMPSLQYRLFKPGQRFSFSKNSQNNCYIIRTGAISMIRQPDDLLLELIESPSIRGIIPVHSNSNALYILKVITPAEIAIISTEEFYMLIERHHLWETYSRHLLAICSSYSEKIHRLVLPSAFDIVRYQLYELMEKAASVRESITAESYIRSKARISRSSVMSILSDLKAGGYIVIEKGILKKINHIPSKY